MKAILNSNCNGVGKAAERLVDASAFACLGGGDHQLDDIDAKAEEHIEEALQQGSALSHRVQSRRLTCA